MTTSIVITSINSINPVMQDYAKLAKEKNFNFIVAGDSKSPEINYPGIDFLSIQDQLNLNLRYPKIAPLKNYCRKNVGYLRAISLGSTKIIETDDDNFPYDSFGDGLHESQPTKILEEPGFANVYSYFTSNPHIWPRGFDLTSLKRKLPEFESLEVKDVQCPIHNGLVDHDPDVDALYRLIFDIPFDFEIKDRALALGKRVWCSFNTQNTTFFPVAYPLMYQPATPLFREADIIRGFVAQKILWENNMFLKFHSPTVKQVRNPHKIIDDLREEVKLYGFVGALCDELIETSIKGDIKNYYDDMIKCYKIVEKYGFINSSEYKLIDAWFEDLSSLKVKG
jgi:hypothetical protein